MANWQRKTKTNEERFFVVMSCVWFAWKYLLMSRRMGLCIYYGLCVGSYLIHNLMVQKRNKI
jgi:hypothetical protein